MEPNPIDLCTVADVKGWLASNTVPDSSNPSDDQIQEAITAWSAMFLQRTGRGPMDGTQPTESPFVQPVGYQEVYDGSGSAKLYLRNFPIRTVASVQVNYTTIPLSTAFGQWGYAVSASKKYLFLRSGSGSYIGTLYGFAGIHAFWKGVQNVQVDYVAGYDSIPDDIFMACMKSSALEAKRRTWLGVRSKSMAQGAGNIVYDDGSGSGSGSPFGWAPDVEQLIRNYSRVWLTV